MIPFNPDENHTKGVGQALQAYPGLVIAINQVEQALKEVTCQLELCALPDENVFVVIAFPVGTPLAQMLPLQELVNAFTDTPRLRGKLKVGYPVGAVNYAQA